MSTAGAQDWLKRLKWPEMSYYKLADRRTLYNERNETIMFVKSYDNFKFYWILDAGHAVSKIFISTTASLKSMKFAWNGDRERDRLLLLRASVRSMLI